MWSATGVVPWASFIQFVMLFQTDDAQFHLTLSPDSQGHAESLCHCLEQVNDWVKQNFLQLTHEHN